MSEWELIQFLIGAGIGLLACFVGFVFVSTKTTRDKYDQVDRALEEYSRSIREQDQIVRPGQVMSFSVPCGYCHRTVPWMLTNCPGCGAPK